MRRIAIVTDSSCDLPAALCRGLGITVVPHYLRIDHTVLHDRVDITTGSFFERLPTLAAPPKTAPPGRLAFEARFRELAGSHDEVIAILLSSKLSGAVGSATSAASALDGAVPIQVVDSYNTSLGLGFQVLHAADLARRGWNAGEIASRLRANVDAYHLVFFVDTLDYLQLGGRVGRATSLVGDLLHLKPLLRVDEGQVVPFDRARTRVRAIEELKRFVASWPSEIARLGVIYTDDRAPAELLARELAGYAKQPLLVTASSPALCANVGPGAMGVCLAEPDIR